MKVCIWKNCSSNILHHLSTFPFVCGLRTRVYLCLILSFTIIFSNEWRGLDTSEWVVNSFPLSVSIALNTIPFLRNHSTASRRKHAKVFAFLSGRSFENTSLDASSTRVAKYFFFLGSAPLIFLALWTSICPSSQAKSFS